MEKSENPGYLKIGVLPFVILDWYNLCKKARNLMSMIALNKQEKSNHIKFLLSQLWHGQTDIALNNLKHQVVARNHKVLLELIGYLEKHLNLNSEDFCLFLSRLGFQDYLNRNLVSDVYLDTVGFSRGNTTLDAVACNLSAVTYAGDFMRGRLADAVLKALGIDETIAHSEAEYVEIPVRLAADREWRKSIVRKMAAHQNRVFKDQTGVPTLQPFLKQVVKLRPPVKRSPFLNKVIER